MKSLCTFLLVLAFTIPTFSQNDQDDIVTTTYYLIRHAEKDRSDKTNRDPELTRAGKKRAKRWQKYFKKVDFDAVYSSNYHRTKQTAQPTANKQKIEISIYDPRQLYSEDFQNETKGKTVLVVGHSNTTPSFVNKILGMKKYEDMDDNNNSSLYIVTISKGKTEDKVVNVN